MTKIIVSVLHSAILSDDSVDPSHRVACSLFPFAFRTSELTALIPALFATAALFCSLLSSFLCKFVSIQEINSGKAVHTGIWLKSQIYVLTDRDTLEWDAFKGCGSYPSGTTYDAYWKTAGAMAIIAVVIGAICTFALYFASCMSFSDSAWKSFGYLLICNTLFQGLTLLFLSSNACSDSRDYIQAEGFEGRFELSGGCEMASGANMSIAATVLWFVAGLTTLKTTNPSPDDQLAQEVVTEAKKTDAADEENADNEESRESKDGEDAA